MSDTSEEFYDGYSTGSSSSGAVKRRHDKDILPKFKLPVEGCLSEPLFSAALAAFAFRIFRLMEAENHQDFLISPFAIFSTLGLILLGSARSTKKETLEVMGFTSDSNIANVLHESCMKILGKYASMSNVNNDTEISIINKLLVDSKGTVSSNFQSEARQFYFSVAEQFDFTESTAVRDVNSWMNAQSNGKIEYIVTSFKNTPTLIPVSGFYLATKPLMADRQESEKLFFHINKNGGPGEFVEIPTLTGIVKAKLGKLQVCKCRVQIVGIPCKDGLEIWYFLPDHARDTKRILNKLAFEDLKQATQVAQQEFVQIFVPKIDSDFNVDLHKILRAMGMREAFCSKKADYSSIDSSGILHLSHVWHASRVQLTQYSQAGNETWKGTGKVRQIKLDRPFIYVIKDTTNDLVLAVGKYTKSGKN